MHRRLVPLNAMELQSDELALNIDADFPRLQGLHRNRVVSFLHGCAPRVE
jgi:hypothetical protein